MRVTAVLESDHRGVRIHCGGHGCVRFTNRYSIGKAQLCGRQRRLLRDRRWLAAEPEILSREVPGALAYREFQVGARGCNSKANNTMLIVHHLNDSRSQRVLWLLEELGVPYEVKRYQRDPKTMLAPAELRTVHALGKAPVI